MIKTIFFYTLLLCFYISAEVSKQNSIEPKKEGVIKFDPLEESSAEEILLFQDLAKRSQEIKAKEEALKKETLLLKAAEVSLNEKLKHFDLLKQDLLKMLETLKEKDNKQLNDLVKIYTTMKPKLAANVWNLMEIPTLKELIKRMEKRKAALILAAMEKEKVKVLSEILAKECQSIS